MQKAKKQQQLNKQKQTTKNRIKASQFINTFILSVFQ